MAAYSTIKYPYQHFFRCIPFATSTQAIVLQSTVLQTATHGTSRYCKVPAAHPIQGCLLYQPLRPLSQATPNIHLWCHSIVKYSPPHKQTFLQSTVCPHQHQHMAAYSTAQCCSPHYPSQRVLRCCTRLWSTHTNMHLWVFCIQHQHVTVLQSTVYPFYINIW